MRNENGKGEGKYKREKLGNENENGIWNSEDAKNQLNSINNEPTNVGVLFDRSEWLTTKEAAIYLRKFEPGGTPSCNAIHKLVARGSIRRRKFSGRLFFRKKELDFLIETATT